MPLAFTQLVPDPQLVDLPFTQIACMQAGASAPSSMPSLTSSQADEPPDLPDEDEEMMDAEDHGDGEEEGAGGGEAVPAAMAAAAEAVGVDLAFLQALPPELRGEVTCFLLL